MREFLSCLFLLFFGFILVLCDLSLPGQQTRMNYPSVFVFIRPSRCFVAVAARWQRRGGRGGRACAAAMVRKTKSELGFGWQWQYNNHRQWHWHLPQRREWR